MATSKRSHVEHPSDREVVFTRAFDAPRELLWKAWSDPVHLHRWFGPAGFTATTSAFAFVPGGEWRFVMHGPDGTDYPNLVVFQELDPPSRLVYDNQWRLPGSPLDFRVEVRFVRHREGTRLSIHFTFGSADDLRTAADVYGVIDGGVQTMQRMEEWIRAAGR